MFTIFFFIFIIYIYIGMQKVLQNQNINPNTLNTLFEVQNFHNILNDNSIPGISLIKASSHGENYLFAKKNNMLQFSIIDINIIYEKAQKEHIHNIILLNQYHTFSNLLLEKIKEYNIQIWDQNKINSLISSPRTNNVLSTSNTTDDTCIIDKNQFDPIQEPHSFLENIFKKPDRL